LIARPLGPGRFIVETADSVLERIWSGIPDEGSSDATESLGEWRSDSTTQRMAQLGNGPQDDGGPNVSGEQLLSSLGL
jgi:hypothetical protein